MPHPKNSGAQPSEVDLFDLDPVRRAIAGTNTLVRPTTKFGAMSKLRDPRSLE